MADGGAEPERFEELLRDLLRVDLGKPEGACAESREQRLQTGSTVIDERAKRQNLRRRGGRVKKVRLDSLLGGDAESCDVVLPRSDGLDRALPAHVRVSLIKETIGGEIVDGNRNDEHPSCFPLFFPVMFQNPVCQRRFLDVSARAEQRAGSGESLGDFGDHSRGAENRELRAERSEKVTAMTLPQVIGVDGDLMDESTGCTLGTDQDADRVGARE